jgi:hypothetical protein
MGCCVLDHKRIVCLTRLEKSEPVAELSEGQRIPRSARYKMDRSSEGIQILIEDIQERVKREPRK